MSTYLLKFVIFGMIVLFGAVAMFLGIIVGYAALQSGELTLTAGRVSTTVARALDPGGFWRGFGLASALPVIGGFIAVVVGRRGIGRL